MQNIALENGLNEKLGRETHVTKLVQITESEREQKNLTGRKRLPSPIKESPFQETWNWD